MTDLKLQETGPTILLTSNSNYFMSRYKLKSTTQQMFLSTSVSDAAICLSDSPFKTRAPFSQLSGMLAFDNSQLSPLDKGRHFTLGYVPSL